MLNEITNIANRVLNSRNLPTILTISITSYPKVANKVRKLS